MVKEIVGKDGVVLFAKTNVALELGLRESLAEDGHEVWETDTGEFLVQLAQENPSHIVLPALHLTKEKVGTLLHEKLDPSVSANSSHEELVACVRKFLFQKYVIAKVGITGANAVAADTGSVILVENEGNIRMDTTMPSIHVVVTGIDKIVPTLADAFLEAQVQSAYAGLYPPTYINVTSGPSTTADIESKRVTPATGPREFHVVLVDNGRSKANTDPDLREALLCIKCGRCYFSCPVYSILGSDWVQPPYGGPTGAMWSTIVNDDSEPALLCTHSAGCKVVCPVGIDIPRVLEHIKSLNTQKTHP
jgi:L-lactate dehydrogenase complex protein LldG